MTSVGVRKGDFVVLLKSFGPSRLADEPMASSAVSVEERIRALDADAPPQIDAFLAQLNASARHGAGAAAASHTHGTWRTLSLILDDGDVLLDRELDLAESDAAEADL